ncbi:MAG: DUF1062 domain-containing protein, partial [Clostridiaceae bacterium]|nr:DUF1062 domain-containing protein [Clostridiaceae bacterium]
MQKVVWEVQYLSPTTALRHCKKCGKKTEYASSGLFRVNGQGKRLDIWLIYKCSNCDTTWKSAIYSRVSPKSLSPGLLEQFHANDSALAEKYAMDVEMLRRNGVEAGLPGYKVAGEEIPSNTSIMLYIKSKYPSQIKVSAILRDKLSLSQRAYENMVASGQIKSSLGLDLKKCRLHTD